MRSIKATTIAKDATAVLCAGALAIGTAGLVSTPTAQARSKAPAKVRISSVKATTTKVTVKVKKAKRASFYQYKIGTNKKVSKGVKTSATSRRSYTFSGLKSGKRYYVKVRAYGSKWGKWSKVKSVKTAKKAEKRTNMPQAGKRVNGVYKGDGYEISNVMLSVRGTTATLSCTWKNVSGHDLNAAPGFRVYQDGYRLEDGYLFGETMQNGYSQNLTEKIKLRNSTRPVQVVIGDYLGFSLEKIAFDRTFDIS